MRNVMDERYSIEVFDEVVEIYGDLTIEEAFDFLNFFDKKGYKSVVLGSENSTLRMMRRSQDEVRENQRRLDIQDELDDTKSLLKKEKESNLVLRKRNDEIELLIKQLMSEEYKKYKSLYDENQKLIKAQCVWQLEQNPEVKEIIDNMKMGCDPKGTEMPFDWTTMKPVQPLDYYINPDPTKE